MTPTKKLPLFIVSGASGAGKSTLCELLFREESRYIVLESDILWNKIYEEDKYRAYRRMQMKLCANVAQIGLPVVLCGCAVPEQFENLPERALFTQIYYLAVVCDDEALKKKMKKGRRIHDRKWIASSLEFNRWLKENGEANGMALLDNTHLTPREGADAADRWICGVLD
ncbi:MAG: AAA family ATPase [Firmicutes bacterium]|nr:AAA family ATPase [Bacillota bacterium]